MIWTAVARPRLIGTSIGVAFLMLGMLFQLPAWAAASTPAAGEAAARPGASWPWPSPPADATTGDVSASAGDRFVIVLAAQARLQQPALPAAELARRTEIIRRLRETAQRTQPGLLSHLAQMRTAGQVRTFRPLWIVNAVAVTGDPAAIKGLAARADVAAVHPDAATPLLPDGASPLDLYAALAPADEPPSADRPAWGVARVGAPAVWRGLGINGSGVTVAVVDSGVAWQHPDLYPAYRGRMAGGRFEHTGNWFHAAYPTRTTPLDPLGHGTHVAGTVVGQNGLGVAPGARWIAVAVSDDNGLIYDSVAQAAFQWILAPGGDPALAPDIVTNSWGNQVGFATALWPAVRTLQAAGIVTLFAAGNNGPQAGTIGAPASFTDTIAVGASDDIDAVAWFSSRGPSPLTEQVKPLLVAPGTRIRSSYPPNQYALANGTSMATPHVAGAVALLLSANPALTQAQIGQILAETAVPLAPSPPDGDAGWGRLDAYAAVAQVTPVGTLAVSVRRDGLPLAGAVVSVTNYAGQALTYTADAAGSVAAPLRPGRYQVATAPFGATPAAAADQAVQAGQVTGVDLAVSSLPGGVIAGQVRGGGFPLAGATIRVADVPVAATTDARGAFTVTLPAGVYRLEARATGFLVAETSLGVANGASLEHDFYLTPAPSILLVEAGQWYYDSQSAYYQDALQRLQLAYDQWPIRQPFADHPTTLANYDLVIWADPLASPGTIGANNVITDYLGAGGQMLISGQDVGRRDGVGFGNQVWWRGRLQARFDREQPASSAAPIAGTPGSPWAGLTLSLNGPNSAANQVWVDQASPLPLALTYPVLSYADGSPAALAAGACRPFRLVYTGFGLEGISGGPDRAALLDRSLAFFAAPPRADGVRWFQSDRQDLVLPGATITYALTLQNLSETVTETFDLRLPEVTWAGELLTPTLTLGPCRQGSTVVSVTVPVDAPRDATQTTRVVAQGRAQTTSTAVIQLQQKTPGRILLVDGARFYDHAPAYQAALAELGVAHDTWDVVDNDPQRADGPVPGALLAAYDIVLWFTGNDWYGPVTQGERQDMAAYLAQGGRLFLSSQDFFYYPAPPTLAQYYLGVQEPHVDVTPTVALPAGHTAAPPDLAGPMPIDYGPTRNQGDGIVPAGHSQVYLFHDRGLAAAVTTAGPSWRTSFWSIPWERLPAQARTPALAGVLGWLSDLGESSLAVDARAAPAGLTRTFTVTVRNWEAAPTNTVSVTVTLPPGLNLYATTVRGAGSAAPGRLQWQGSLAQGASHVISYQARVDAAAGARLDTVMTLAYARHGLRFSRTASMWVTAPDLSASRLEARLQVRPPRDRVTFTVALRNQGLADAGLVTAVLRAPPPLTPLPSTLAASHGSAAITEQGMQWLGAAPPGVPVTITLAFSQANTAPPGWTMGALWVDDGLTDPVVRWARFYLAPYVAYFPAVAHHGLPAGWSSPGRVYPARPD